MLLTSLFAGIKVRTEKEELFSAPYEKLKKIKENIYVGELILKTSLGDFEFCDDIILGEDGCSISVNCTLKDLSENVNGVGIYCGVNLVDKFKELQFFAPSAWYGNKDLFEGKSNKMPLINGIAGASIDCIGVPICSAFNFINNKAYSLEVLNAKYDSVINPESNVIIDERVKLSGIGVKAQNSVELFYQYPATYYHISGQERTVEWYLPANTTKKITAQYKIMDFQADDYYSFMKKTWRYAYDKYSQINDGIDTAISRKVLLNYVAESYDVISNVPQYMTNTDHFATESGFLYRNADIAYLMLRYGYEVKDNDIIKKAKNVLNAQVEQGFLGDNQVFPFERSRAEGCIALLHAYKFLKQKGINYSHWYKYVKNEVERFVNINEYYSVPLLCEMGNIKSAIEKGEKVWVEFSKMRFFGGIVDFVDQIVVDRESGYLGLYAFISIYEFTKDEKWLNRAMFCADYLETYQNLRKEGFYLYETTGNEHYNMASIGNEKLRLNGLSFISANCSAGDVMNVLAVPLYYKLYKYSSDVHYYNYACLLERNGLEYVDLYNKAGSLADVLLSSGLGYTSEYYQLAISNDPVCPFTGCAHDANIAWVPYVLLNSQQEIYDLTGKYFLKESSAEEIVMNVSPDCEFEYENHSIKNLNSFDFYKTTCFSKGTKLKITLNSNSGKIVLFHVHPYKEYKYLLHFYDHNNTLVKDNMVERAARFVSVSIPNDCTKIYIEFLDNVSFRQIQIFAKDKIEKVFDYQNRQKTLKCDKDIFASGTYYSAERKKSFPFDYLYKEKGMYKQLYYDNVKNSYCCKEPYLQIKTGNIVHPGKNYPAVRSFTVTSDGRYDIFCELSASTYLKNFGNKVIIKIYENQMLLIEKTYIIQKKRSEVISFKRKLKKKDVLYFEVWAVEENNKNCLISNEIVIRKELK